MANVIPIIPNDDFIGGVGLVACLAESIELAVKLISKEFAENGSLLIGFDWISRLAEYNQPLTEYAQQLIDRLGAYPVQFDNVHTFKQTFEH
jgi:hypothetical protein